MLTDLFKALNFDSKSVKFLNNLTEPKETKDGGSKDSNISGKEGVNPEATKKGEWHMRTLILGFPSTL